LVNITGIPTVDVNGLKSCNISNQVSHELRAVDVSGVSRKEKIKLIKVLTRCNSAECGFHRHSGYVTTIDREIFTVTWRIVTSATVVQPTVTGASQHHDDDKSDHLTIIKNKKFKT